MSYCNVVDWTTAMLSLHSVNHLLDRMDGKVPGGTPCGTLTSIENACRILGLPGEETWPDHGTNPITATVFDADGRDLTKLYLIVFADDATPQFPDGEPGVLALYCDIDGRPVPAMSENWAGSDRIGVFPWPGIKIAGRR